MHTLTPHQILAIPLHLPGHLFSFAPDVRKSEWRKLSSDYHPDKGGDAAVLAHINTLYDASHAVHATGIWEERESVLLQTGSQVFSMQFEDAFNFELGRVYVGKRNVLYVVREEFSDLYENGVRVLRGLKFTGPAAQKNHERYYPKIAFDLRTSKARLLVLVKPENSYRLKTVVEAIQPFNPRHTAWICNWVYDMSMGLAHLQEVVHPDISMDTVFINPADHVGVLMGGWWYAAPRGGRLAYAPPRSVEQGMPVPAASASAVYPFLVRLLAREMLGDAGGSKLLMRSDLPAPLVRWARTTASGTLLEDFNHFYNKVVIDAFGKRQFVVLDYPPGGKV